MPFIFAEHGQCPFLIGRIDLIFLTNTNGFHSPMPATAHHIAHIFEICNLFRCQTDFTSSGDSFAFSNVSRLKGENKLDQVLALGLKFQKCKQIETVNVPLQHLHRAAKHVQNLCAIIRMYSERMARPVIHHHRRHLCHVISSLLTIERHPVS